MAKQKETQKKASTSKKSPKAPKTPKVPKKKSNSKWIIIVLVLLLIGAYLYIYQQETIYRTVANSIGINNVALPKKGGVDSKKENVFNIFDDEKDTSPKLKNKHRSNQNYYVLMQVCLNLHCVTAEKNRIRAMKRSYYLASNYYNTMYYEVISIPRLEYNKANSVVDILTEKLYNTVEPTVKAVGREKYKVSFGLFTNKDKGEQVYLSLLRTYAFTKVKFNLVPHKKRIKIYRVYLGPLDHTTALKLVIKSHLQGEFSAKKLFSRKELKL